MSLPFSVSLSTPEIDVAARQIVAALGCSGFAHLDFVIEKDSGHAFFVEMNPHAPSELHLGKLVGTDLCGPMARQLGGLTEITEAATPGDQRPIALFPRAKAGSSSEIGNAHARSGTPFSACFPHRRRFSGRSSFRARGMSHA